MEERKRWIVFHILIHASLMLHIGHAIATDESEPFTEENIISGATKTSESSSSTSSSQLSSSFSASSLSSSPLSSLQSLSSSSSQSSSSSPLSSEPSSSSLTPAPSQLLLNSTYLSSVSQPPPSTTSSPLMSTSISSTSQFHSSQPSLFSSSQSKSNDITNATPVSEPDSQTTSNGASSYSPSSNNNDHSSHNDGSQQQETTTISNITDITTTMKIAKIEFTSNSTNVDTTTASSNHHSSNDNNTNLVNNTTGYKGIDNQTNLSEKVPNVTSSLSSPVQSSDIIMAESMSSSTSSSSSPITATMTPSILSTSTTVNASLTSAAATTAAASTTALSSPFATATTSSPSYISSSTVAMEAAISETTGMMTINTTQASETQHSKTSQTTQFTTPEGYTNSNKSMDHSSTNLLTEITSSSTTIISIMDSIENTPITLPHTAAHQTETLSSAVALTTASSTTEAITTITTTTDAVMTTTTTTTTTAVPSTTTAVKTITIRSFYVDFFDSSNLIMSVNISSSEEATYNTSSYSIFMDDNNITTYSNLVSFRNDNDISTYNYSINASLVMGETEMMHNFTYKVLNYNESRPIYPYPQPPKNVSFNNCTTDTIIITWHSTLNKTYEFMVNGTLHNNSNWEKTEVQEVHANLYNLTKSGSIYNISIRSQINGKFSPWMYLLGYTKPEKPLNLQFQNRTSSDICFSLEQSGNMDGVMIRGSGINSSLHYKCPKGSDMIYDNCCVTNLSQSGHEYKFQVSSYINTMGLSSINKSESDAFEYNEWTAPEKVLISSNKTVTNDTVQLALENDINSTNFESLIFHISQMKTNQPWSINKTISKNESKYGCQLSDLSPGGLFNITVYFAVHNIIGEPFELFITTVPNPPSSVEYQPVNQSTAQLNIIRPNNGFCTHYQVDFRLNDSNAEKTKRILVPKGGEITEYVLRELEDDEYYVVNVFSLSNYTDAGVVGEECSKTSSSSTSKGFYTPPTGISNLRNHTIADPSAMLISFNQPRNHKHIQCYYVLVNKSLNTTLVCSGRLYQSCNQSRGAQSVDCANEEIAFNLTNLVQSSKYNVEVQPEGMGGVGLVSDPLMLQTAQVKQDPSPSNGGAPVAVIIVIVLLILAVVIAGLMYIKRTDIQKKIISIRSGSTASAMVPHVNVTEHLQQVPIPIRIVDFPKEVSAKHKDSEYGFSREYEFLNDTSPKHPTTNAEKPENRVKNRFVDILAFDHSRVKLSGSEMTESGDISDYINANFIPGFSSKREYIACQGPMKSTVDHFWQMVWEQKVNTIVMLTKLFEKGREKCTQYWPESGEESQVYGEIQVTFKTLSSLNYYELRTFQVSYGSESRDVRHFWFLNWPDFGVPVEDELLTCLKDVRQMSRPMTGLSPSVIHCSAGVGRTGTYILLDWALQILEHDSFIDVFGIVRDMRENRCRMVQTEAQYIFAHDCIKTEILRCLEKEENEVTYVNQSFINEPLYENSTFHMQMMA